MKTIEEHLLIKSNLSKLKIKLKKIRELEENIPLEEK